MIAVILIALIWLTISENYEKEESLKLKHNYYESQPFEIKAILDRIAKDSMSP